MTITLRLANPSDAEACGRICYSAFAALAVKHDFPPDFPSPEVAAGLLSQLIADEGFYGVVAEVDGQVVGSNFLDERSIISGVGPITVEPAQQNRAVGRLLMDDVMTRATVQGAAGIRLCQVAYHNRSLGLYSKLGFDVREPLSVMQGPELALTMPGHAVRPAGYDDLAACNDLCRRIHGHDRANELQSAVAAGTARVVENSGKITGYAGDIAFFAHAVGESNADLQALIAATKIFGGPGFLLPTRNAELFRWCLGHGLHVVQQMTLMSVGLYSEPRGVWLPSVLY